MPEPTGNIIAIEGLEPMREHAYPFSYEIGSPVNGAPGNRTVLRIDFRSDNYGDHSENWFDVHLDDNSLTSISSRAVGTITRKPERNDG